MPTALAKSKHGWKAGVAKHTNVVPVDTCPGTSQPCATIDRATSSKDSCAPHKPCSHSKAVSRDERRRDQALQKMCDKSSKHASSAIETWAELGSSTKVFSLEWSPVVTTDQVSLRDCPLSISVTHLWGPTTAPLPVGVEVSAPGQSWTTPSWGSD